MLERSAALHRALGDVRPLDVLRRGVLASAIFGVDVNPMAVWLCELRLWLSCVIESGEADPRRVLPLPNLDRNIRVGDALLGDGFESTAIMHGSTAVLSRMRLRYARATGRRKASLARTLDREVRRYLSDSVRRELQTLNARRLALITATRGRDLFGGRRGALPAEQEQLDADRLRARELRRRMHALDAAATLPFSFPTHFADVLHHGGFDVVLGNPPWVRPHNLGPTQREALRRRFEVLRDAAWRRGAELARARSGFGSQADLAAAFVERGASLLREGGTLALLVPAKLWKSLAGAGVRRYLQERMTLRVLEDWSDAPAVFDAAVYPSLVVAQRGDPAPNELAVTIHRRALAVRWRAALQSLPFDGSAGSPWLVLPPDARAGFDRLAACGVPLHACGIGRITLGVKTGYNAAFIPEEGSDPVEPSLMRPLLRGEDVTPWTCAASRRIIWTHGRTGAPLERLPPLARMHFATHRYALEQRRDARGARWWAVFRTEGARYDHPRVVWADVTRSPRAAVLRTGDDTVPLNTCYVVSCRDDGDAFTLAALLNSPIAAAWLGALAEPARGGYRRLLAWTMALFPVPDDWDRARDVLGTLGACAVQGHRIAAADLLQAACQAYRIRPNCLTALCNWLDHRNG